MTGLVIARGGAHEDPVAMTPPKSETGAVVVPFGVPNERRGLGLGLAALVHGFARIRGQHVALAQLGGPVSTLTTTTSGVPVSRTPPSPSCALFATVAQRPKMAV